MKVNLNTYSTGYFAQKSSPSFGLIRFINSNDNESTDEGLERLLTERQYQNIKDIKKNDTDDRVFLDIFVKGNDLSATLFSNPRYVDTSDWRVEGYERKVYESPNHFLSRMIKKMNKMKNTIEANR